MTVGERKARELVAASQKEARDALDADRCPLCGQGVRQNRAVAGWVQCKGFDAPGFRTPGVRACGWQGFTR